MSTNNTSPKFFATATGITHIAGVILLAREKSGKAGISTFEDAIEHLEDLYADAAGSENPPESFAAMFQADFEAYYVALEADSSELAEGGDYADVGTAAAAEWEAHQDSVIPSGGDLVTDEVEKPKAKRKSRKLTDEEKAERRAKREAKRAAEAEAALAARTEELEGLRVRPSKNDPDAPNLEDEYCKVHGVEKIPAKDPEGNRWKGETLVKAILDFEAAERVARKDRKTRKSATPAVEIPAEMQARMAELGVKRIPPMGSALVNPVNPHHVAAYLLTEISHGAEAAASLSPDVQLAYMNHWLDNKGSKPSQWCIRFVKAEAGSEDAALWVKAGEINAGHYNRRRWFRDDSGASITATEKFGLGSESTDTEADTEAA